MTNKQPTPDKQKGKNKRYETKRPIPDLKKSQKSAPPLRSFRSFRLLITGFTKGFIHDYK